MVESSHRFPSEFRLKDRRVFSRLSYRGRFFSTDHVVIHWGKSSSPHARLGITVVRRFGSAVERNTFRRRAKEAFRLSSLREIPGIDINLKPKKSISVSFSEFCTAFERFEKMISHNT